MSEETKDLHDSRRDILKKGVKAAAFMVPVMVSFKLSDVAVAASCDCRYVKTKAKFKDIDMDQTRKIDTGW